MGMMHAMPASLPFGAWRILEARKKGKKPADMVLVSFIGKLENEANPVVQALPEMSHDWTWARGLVICFWTTPQEYTARHIIDCAKVQPAAIYLWDCANEKGYDISYLPTAESIHLPREKWDWKVVADRWIPYQERKFSQGEYVWN